MPDSASILGRTISHYRILEKIGAGGMGEVYRAHDEQLDRDVALKVLPPGTLADEAARKQFRKEALALAKLNHPNIETVHEFGTQDGLDFLAMELIAGGSISEKLKTGPFPLKEIVRLGMQFAEGLAAAHGQGIVHRDLKPSNLMITPDGRLKILDLGLAKLVHHDLGGDLTRSITVETGTISGTVPYMSPEQLRGLPVDARSDIYAAGAVLYEMATCHRPFPQSQSVELMDAILHQAPASPSLLNPRIAPGLDSVILKALEKEPSQRYQSARELLVALEGISFGAVTPAKGAVPAAVVVVPTVASGPPRVPEARRSSWPLIAGAALVVAALGAGGFWWLNGRKARALTEKDTVVLADFTNTTGDPVFDGTLRQGLAIQLEQSPFLKIMDDEQVQQDRRLMNLPAGGRITNQIAHDICVREGVSATIDGSIESLGKDYVITLQAITCRGGATLAREQIQAGDKEHVLNALGTAATAMRAKLGESLSSIEKMNRPLEQATTSSLEALQSYTAGYSEMGLGQFMAAVPLFERAIALDPDFAMAYFFLGVAFNNAGDIERSREYTQKAFGLIDRVSEFERDLIVPTYYSYDGQSDKAIDASRLGIQDYPRWWGFHNLLSVEYIDQGQFEEGLKEGLEATGLEANVEPPYRRQLDAYMCLDRLAEATQLAGKLRAQGLGGARIHQRFLEMAYVEGDDAAAAREIQWFAGNQAEYLSFGLQAANQNALGQRRESSKLYRRAAETALRHGLRNAAAEFEEADARADALSGNCQTVRRRGRPALALAMCGDAAQAEKLAGETSKLFPNGTLWNAVQLPAIRAAIALKSDQPAKAVELLASASPYERAYPEAVYLRGLAYLGLLKGAEAAAEFEKILDHKGASWGSAWQHPYWGQYYSLSYVGLARASALAGDPTKAKRAYTDFLTLWKDADPGIPILVAAKSEFAKLQ
jgi:tetratricopeptide (TPR) repeat protein